MITPITATFPALNFPKEVDYPTQEDWAAFSAAAELNYGILSGEWSLKSELYKNQMNTLALQIQDIGENAINAITFDNIAELRLNSNIERVDILGSITKGDGGAATYYWNPTSVESDDGYTIIQATGITIGRWKRANIQSILYGNKNKKHIAIGAIPKCTAGVFSLLNDAGHNPLNVSSVSQPDDYIIRINYEETASRINSFIIQQDNELAPYGIDIGGDVGLSYANTKAYTAMCGYFNNTTVTSNKLIKDDMTSSIYGSRMTINHASTLTGDVPIVSVVSGLPSNTMNIAVGYSESKITIDALSDISGYLSYSGTAWTITLTNNDSSTLSATFTAPSGGGTIKVNHISASDYNVLLTPQGATYRVAITNIDLNLFEVAFINNAGTVVTTPDTNMKVYFRRKALIKSTFPTTMGILARRGNIPVKSARFSNVTGNNFWVSGTMETN